VTLVRLVCELMVSGMWRALVYQGNQLEEQCMQIAYDTVILRHVLYVHVFYTDVVWPCV